MNVPTEILIQIASYLNARELRSFRCINRRCSRAGISFIARNGLSVLNTSTGFNDIQQLCKSITGSARKLTISHGDWPVCTRKEWEVHPLLFGGQSRFQTLQTLRADKAFEDYSAFIAEEDTARPHGHVDAIFETLNLLSKLRTIVISDTKAWAWHPSRNTKYRDFMQKIWMAPRIDDNVAPAVQTFLLAFGDKFPHISCLEIHGTLNPSELYLCRPGLQFPSIHKLSITSLHVGENEEVIQKFLQAFPNLEDLSIMFTGWDQSILSIVGGLFWPNLKKIRLDELWASEDDIFNFYKSHQYAIEQFNLGNMTLIQGSWRSLFTRIRGLNTRGQIAANGELYGRRSRNTLNMTPAALSRLVHFMQENKAPWPFQ
jgi:hypothetical protein